VRHATASATFGKAACDGDLPPGGNGMRSHRAGRSSVRRGRRGRPRPYSDLRIGPARFIHRFRAAYFLVALLALFALTAAFSAFAAE